MVFQMVRQVEIVRVEIRDVRERDARLAVDGQRIADVRRGRAAVAVEMGVFAQGARGSPEEDDLVVGGRAVRSRGIAAIYVVLDRAAGDGEPVVAGQGALAAIDCAAVGAAEEGQLVPAGLARGGGAAIDISGDRAVKGLFCPVRRDEVRHQPIAAGFSAVRAAANDSTVVRAFAKEGQHVPLGIACA